MSIYGTEFTFYLQPENDQDRPVEVMVQVVPAWVDFECDYLPPPRKTDGDGYEHPRAAVFCAPWTIKAGPGRGGQEYVNPLLVLTGEEYETLSFWDVMGRLHEALEGVDPFLREPWARLQYAEAALEKAERLLPGPERATSDDRKRAWEEFEAAAKEWREHRDEEGFGEMIKRKMEKP